MSNERRRKVKDIVLKIGDRNKTVQGVTEQTTCCDVIKIVLRKMENAKENAYSYAVFECGNDSERMLSDKTKVLKTMRSWGSDNSYHFSLKSARRASKIFKQDKSRKTHKVTNNLNVTSRIESAAKLAHFVQSQQARLQRRQSTNHVTEIYCNDGETSIDEFLSNIDTTKMAGFLNFCGTVTANELVRLSGITDNSTAGEPTCTSVNGFVNGKVISRVDKINDVKYATKKVLKPKRVTVTYGHANTRLARKHTFVDCEPRNVPTHSTPIRRDAKPNLKRHEELAEDIATKITRMSQREGKDVILEKYFADYLSYNSPNGKPFPMPKRERGDGAETSFSIGNPDKGDGSFSTGTPLRSKTTRARRHSDSDSGQEDHDHEDNLDNAFVCIKTVRKHVDSNPRYAHIKSLSRKLVNYDVTMATQIDKLVDYSYSDTSVLESDENTVHILERNVFDEDDKMASFMDSKLYDDFSDEGMSSLGSADEKEILV